MEHELLTFLTTNESYPHPVREIKHLETHISHVFLTGDYAYKLKKPVKFDFLDFSTLEKRKFYCNEEIRLNARFAPELYLSVLPISRQNGRLVFGPSETPLEYIIQMKQFDDGSLFDELASKGTLCGSQLLAITDKISQFHRNAELQPQYWSSEYVAKTLRENFMACERFRPNPVDPYQLELLRSRSEAAFLGQKDLIERRRQTHVRAVHGDLHLRNMCTYKTKPRLFDGIEFNPELSNCDVWADFAFFVMDLLFRDRPHDAALVWNRYLQETDDFEGLNLLDLYLSYRAAVRAKVSCLAIENSPSTDEQQVLREDAAKYLELAVRTFDPREPKLIAVGGLAGTGKSTLSSALACHLGGVHIRSDAVRKHLFGISPQSAAPAAAYSDEMSARTYMGLLERAKTVLRSGRTAVMDAVFHEEVWRKKVEEFALQHSVRFIGIWCVAPVQLAMDRVRLRKGDISDANESIVLLQQEYNLGKMSWHPLDTSRTQQDCYVKAKQWTDSNARTHEREAQMKG